MVSRGEIWLVDLNPIKKNNEIGKVRPVLVYQNNELNHSDYPTTIIIPLTTSLIDDAEPLRMRISKRDDLEKDSDIVITQIRAIDNTRFIKKLASLTPSELAKVKECFNEITM
ncbi:MAG: type II toxin-antitoxin system PemK/MazF family toxin [Sulfuricurvum sp.]|nr:type II toxin-antitoxin system PemK/MazF family toxin [Campylobacterota bacterium]MBD3809589.1 type II toxin-antitoxin system PemK/MazF family toxin [Sulfuricurvum sp.]